MTANHVPMHGPGCPRCDDRRRRLAAFTERLAYRGTPAGQKALAKAELQRIARELAYKNEPAGDGRPHHHKQGRRHRLESNRRRGPVRAIRKLLSQFRNGQAEAA